MGVKKNLTRIVEDFTEGLRLGFGGKPKPKPRPAKLRKPKGGKWDIS